MQSEEDYSVYSDTTRARMTKCMDVFQAVIQRLLDGELTLKDLETLAIHKEAIFELIFTFEETAQALQEEANDLLDQGKEYTIKYDHLREQLKLLWSTSAQYMEGMLFYLRSKNCTAYIIITIYMILKLKVCMPKKQIFIVTL